MKFLQKYSREVKLMGILNVNKDSFFKGSSFNGKEALIHVRKMISDGANIIDIGGVSSKPGSIGVDADEEFSRIKPIVDLIYKAKLHKKVNFSIDSHCEICVKYALEHGFIIVNDITALENNNICKTCIKV